MKIGRSGENTASVEASVKQRDGNLITANGTAHLEFAKEVMIALEAYSVDYIERNYHFFKLGQARIYRSTETNIQINTLNRPKGPSVQLVGKR